MLQQSLLLGCIILFFDSLRLHTPHMFNLKSVGVNKGWIKYLSRILCRLICSRDQSKTLDIADICDVWYLRFDSQEYIQFVEEVSKKDTFANPKSLKIVGPGSAFEEMRFSEASIPSPEKLIVVYPGKKCVTKLKMEFVRKFHQWAFNMWQGG